MADEDRALASEYAQRQLSELWSTGAIGDERWRQLSEQVANATTAAEVIKAVSAVPRLVPPVDQGPAVPGDRKAAIAALGRYQAAGLISEKVQREREDRIKTAYLASEVARQVADLPPRGDPHTGEPGIAPADAVHPSPPRPLGARTAGGLAGITAILGLAGIVLRRSGARGFPRGGHYLTLESVFKDDLRREVDIYDRPAWERAVDAVRAVNAHGLLLDPPPLTGDPLADLLAIDLKLSDLVTEDAGQLRTGPKQNGPHTAFPVAAPELRQTADRIAAGLRRDKMLRDLSDEAFCAKFYEYALKLACLSPLREMDRFAGDRNTMAICMYMSALARDAGVEVDWTKGESRLVLGHLLRDIPNHRYLRNRSIVWAADMLNSEEPALQAAIKRMISRASPERETSPQEWAAAERRRLGLPDPDVRQLKAIGFLDADRHVSGRRRGATRQPVARGPDQEHMRRGRGGGVQRGGAARG